MTDICINLGQSGDAVPFTDQANLIQQQALEGTISRINAILKKVPEFRDNLNNELGDRLRYHDVITIHGGRGSGKTTFILSLFKLIKKNPADPRFKDIAPLWVIDPTLIESKENILVTIIAAIKRQVDEAARQKGFSATHGYRNWGEKLRALARGLQLLDSIGPDKPFGDDWADDTWVLEKGLKNARSGTDFERDFHCFVDASLIMLEKKAFLIAFDDIDTSFERGWPVLETIRKYLTTPQLIVLLSGNLELYAYLVRGRQLENLGPSLLEHGRPSARHHRDLPDFKGDYLVDMVDRLEDQYLLKIIKPENRVPLLSLDYYLRVLGQTIRVSTGKETPEALAAYLESALKAHLCLDHSIEPIEVFREAILRQPVRTAIQILHAVQKADGDAKAFLDSLGEVAAAALFHSHLSPEQVRFADGAGLLWLTIQWLEGADLWDEGYRLVPNHRDEEANAIALVLGGQIADASRRQPEMPLLQILQLNMLREFNVASWPRNEKPSTQVMVQYLDLEHREKPSTITRRMVAAIRSMRVGESFRHSPLTGTFPISGASLAVKTGADKLYKVDQGNIKALENPPAKISEYLARVRTHIGSGEKPWHVGVTMNTLQSLSDGLGTAKFIVSLPASITPDAATGRQTTFYSIFGLLGVLAELLSREPTEEDLWATLSRLGQVRTYPLPPWVPGGLQDQIKSKPDEEEAEQNLANGDVEKTFDMDELVKSVKHWVEGARRRAKQGETAYHPHVYSRIGTRLYYTLQRMDDEAKGPYYAGELIHRYVIAFLNAVLVEERLARGASMISQDMDGGPLELSNPTTDDQRFLRNIPKKKYRNIHEKGDLPPYATKIDDKYHYDNSLLLPEKAPLFFTFFSCPLLAFFVEPSTKLTIGSAGVEWDLLGSMRRTWSDPAAEITKVRFEVKHRGSERIAVDFPNLYHLLNSVPVLGQD